VCKGDEDRPFGEPAGALCRRHRCKMRLPGTPGAGESDEATARFVQCIRDQSELLLAPDPGHPEARNAADGRSASAVAGRISIALSQSEPPPRRSEGPVHARLCCVELAHRFDDLSQFAAKSRALDQNPVLKRSRPVDVQAVEEVAPIESNGSGKRVRVGFRACRRGCISKRSDIDKDAIPST